MNETNNESKIIENNSRTKGAKKGWAKRKEKAKRDVKKMFRLKFINGVLAATVVFLILVILFLVAYEHGRITETQKIQKEQRQQISGLEFVAQDLLLYQKIEDILLTTSKEHMTRDEAIDCARTVYKYHKDYGNTLGLTYGRILAVIDIESRFDPKAKSSAGALGLMQIMPSNLQYLLKKCFGLSGLTLKQRIAYAKDPNMNLIMGLELLIELQLGYMSADKANKGDWKLAHSRYNWSKKSVEALEGSKYKTEPKASLSYALEVEGKIKAYEDWRKA